MDKIKDSSIVYMCKSAYYPEYRRRILSLLSLPNGAKFETDYDEKWVVEEIKNDPDRFKGKDCYTLFMDLSLPDPNFYPLRKCKILNIISAAGLFKFTLEMGNFKIPSAIDSFSPLVRKTMNDKGILNIEKRKLVFNGDNTIEKEFSEKTQQEDTWKQIVEYLVSLGDIEIDSGRKEAQFKRSLFYQIKILKKNDLKSPQLQAENVKLEHDKEYFIRLHVYQPHAKNFDAKESAILNFLSEDKYIRHIGEGKIIMPLSQRVYDKDIEFWTRNVMMGGKTKILLERSDDVFNAPSLSLYFYLPVRIWRVLPIFIGIMLGLSIIGASDILSQQIGLPKLFWSSCGAVLSSAILVLLDYLRGK